MAFDAKEARAFMEKARDIAHVSCLQYQDAFMLYLLKHAAEIVAMAEEVEATRNMLTKSGYIANRNQVNQVSPEIARAAYMKKRAATDAAREGRTS